jgi:hypothetical protein
MDHTRVDLDDATRSSAPQAADRKPECRVVKAKPHLGIVAFNLQRVGSKGNSMPRPSHLDQRRT